MMQKTLDLGGRLVGRGQPCYIIAEVGSNHNRDLNEARLLIDTAREHGCDAVKFQSYTADGLYSIYAPRISEMEGRSLERETPYQLIKRIEMPAEWHAILADHCRKTGITFCSTPFEEDMVDLLEAVDVPFFKVASYEITHYPLLQKIARTGRPVILSTGNSTLRDIEEALDTLERNGCSHYALLHCVSRYPAEYADIHLRCLLLLESAFGCPVGFSDHTTDALSSALAVSLGACIIEKHITMDKTHPGPDHPFSLEPGELKHFVDTLRDAEKILGSPQKEVQESERENHLLARRSIVAAVDIRRNEVITSDKLAVKRPGLGLHPRFLDLVIGKKSRKDIPKDMWLTWDCFFEEEA